MTHFRGTEAERNVAKLWRENVFCSDKLASAAPGGPAGRGAVGGVSFQELGRQTVEGSVGLRVSVWRVCGSETARNMSSFLLLLVCVGAVLSSARSQDPYQQLPDSYKLGVDLALENLHSLEGIQHHFRFLRSLKKSDISSGFGVTYYFHHFHLKPTRCARGVEVSDPQLCPFRNDRPAMDCAVCYKVSLDQIEASPKPYVHCIQRPRLTEEMKVARADHCRKINYNSGAPTLLAVSMG